MAALVEWVSSFTDQLDDLDPRIKVYRAVNPKLVNWEVRDASGFPQLQSNVFQHMSDAMATELGYDDSAMSVALSHILEANHEEPIRVLDKFKMTWGIAEITVAQIRLVQPAVGVCIDPLPDAPWHGLVFSKTRPRMKSPESMALRSFATLIRSPQQTT